MADEYTPTTEQVRKNWAYTKAGDRIHRTDDHFAEFDRWLAAHDEGVRQEERERIAGAILSRANAIPNLVDFKRHEEALISEINGMRRAARIAESGGAQ